MTDTLTTLIRALEEATEGSPALDEAVYDVIGRPGDDDPRYFAFLHGDCPPHYTTSIDAALPGEDTVMISEQTTGRRLLQSVFQREIRVAGRRLQQLLPYLPTT